MTVLEIKTFQGAQTVRLGLGQGSAGPYTALLLDRITGNGSAQTVLRAVLPQPIDIPAEFIVDQQAPGIPKLKPISQVAGEAVARCREAVRRLANQQIDWRAQGGAFLGLPGGFAGAEFQGEARLALDDELASVRAEFAVRAVLNATVNGSQVQRGVALVVAVASPVPTLRLDFDDLNISLPEIDFPRLDLSGPVSLALDTARAGVARVFARLAGAAGDVTVEVKTGAASPALALTPSGGVLSWRLAESGAPGAALAQFDITVKRAGTVIATIQNFTAESVNGGMTLNGTVTAGLPDPVPILDGTHAFGPLSLGWRGVSVAPVVGKTLGGGDAGGLTIRAKVEIARLTVFATSDPDAVLALSGTLELTPSGMRVLALKLLEPSAVDLIAPAGDVMQRGAAAVLRLLATVSLPLEGLQKILGVLGRMAEAIGRAAGFVERAAAEALRAVAVALGRVLRDLAKLAKAADALAIEIRIGTAPFELRQVLITLKDDSAHSLSALGFKLAIQPGWHPGLLLDFVDAPGAYLVAARAQPGAAPLADLSTDLWLKPSGEANLRSIPDADPKSGDRADQPLLLAKASINNPAETCLILLAGVRSGHGVFLQRFVSPGATAVAGVGGISIVSPKGSFSYLPLTESDIHLEVEFTPKRVLPFLGMGEPGRDGGNKFLEELQKSLGQTVWVERTEPAALHGSKVTAGLVVGVKVAGMQTSLTLDLTLDLGTFEINLDLGDKKLPINSRRIEQHALGLTWVVERRKTVASAAEGPDPLTPMFWMSFKDGESSLELNKEAARMEVRFAGLSSDSKGVALEVETFVVSRGGLDLVARTTGEAVVLNGIDVPFRFTKGLFEIRGGKLVQAAIGGHGSLPKGIVGDAQCDVMLNFGQDAGSNDIVLQKGIVEFGKRGEPIACETTRFTLTIDELDIGFAADHGYHFFFLVTGAIQFTPKSGEFESGLLQFLKDVRIDLTQAPLTSDPRVLLKHISFQKALNPKKTFNLFNLFEFELRGFGFHPVCSKFGGKKPPPAINISGQIKFAQIGDVMQPSIDFHDLWIAPPEDGQTMPRIKADGLAVDIGISGTARIRGSVLAVDPQTPGLEGQQAAPPGYDAYGFLGSGEVAITGWATVAASFGFLEVAPKDAPEQRRKAFFLYLEAQGLSVEIPVVVWTFYMREVGFGFGFRYTLAGLKEAERATSAAQLVRVLDEVSKRQGDLSRFGAWMADPEGDNVSLAMRALFQCYPAPKQFNAEKEAAAEEPFLFDIVAALRSDMTFLMSARGWVATNYADFWKDKDGSQIRSKPGLRGYMFISAPRSELLMRAIGDSRGYVGDRLGNIDTLKAALRSVDWSMTLFVNPRLFHLELGWPNELVVRLKDEPNFRVTVRGGMIFRVAEDGLLWGYNIEADAFIAFAGSVGGGALGVSVEASLTVRFVARLIAFISWRLAGTLIYGLVSLDANLTFRVRAWMEIDLWIGSVTISISFSFSVQFSASVELAISTEGVGARVAARIAVSVFGCTLGVGLDFTVNGGRLDQARARVQRFLALGLGNEAAPPAGNVLQSGAADRQVSKDAEHAGASAPVPLPPPPTPIPGVKPPVRRTGAYSHAIGPTRFWLVLHRDGAGPAGSTYGLLVPRAPENDETGGFYAPPLMKGDGTRDGAGAHYLTLTETIAAQRWLADQGGWSKQGDRFDGPADAVWKNAIPAQDANGDPLTGEKAFTLGHLCDECFVYDADWLAGSPPLRVTTNWQEPPPRRHAIADRPSAGDSEQQRKLDRNNRQRDRAALAASNPIVAAVYDARSTVLSMFLDQFVAFAQSGVRPPADQAHVLDLGLVFKGDGEALAKFGAMTVQTRVKLVDGSFGVSGPGTPVELFNPPSTWFEKVDPILAYTKDPRVEADGVKLDWHLVPFANAPTRASPHDERGDPEQYLHHYEITCELDGVPRWDAPKLIKPAATEGGTDDENLCHTLAPEWQFVDDLADLTETRRRALLPTTGEENALSAALAWAEAYSDAPSVALTYSVTPVDIAGTRGSERSFIVEVARPQAPIRPATAELRFIFEHDSRDWLDKDQAPGNLAVVLALRDRWDDSPGFACRKLPDGPLGSGSALGQRFAHRLYRLVLDPEDILPSGTYGSDGLTGRPSSLPSAAQPKSGEETAFAFGRGGFSACNIHDPTSIEPDEDQRAEDVKWLLLSGATTLASQALLKTALDGDRQNALFDALWRRTDDEGVTSRVAARFSLETLILITGSSTLGAAPDLTKAFVSRRTPVAVELRLNPGQASAANQSVLLRPETFEWPVRLDLPPLGPGEVRAAAGFARFLAPTAEATLDSMLHEGLTALRDPERRVLTTLEWDALPAWAGSTSGQPHKALHAATVGGYDLHELDVGNAAPLDVDNKPFAENESLWRQARRVARVQLVPRSEAMLSPHGNDDLLGWQAHYPSETWRAQRDVGGAGTHLPIRKPWWSAAESTVRFASRVIRRRLLPLADETVTGTLMSAGLPARVFVKLAQTRGSRAAETFKTGAPPLQAISLGIFGSDALPQLTLVPDANPGSKWEGWYEAQLAGRKQFQPGDLRAVQLCLAWTPAAAHDGDYAGDPGVLDGLTLNLGAVPDVRGDPKPVIAELPLAFPPERHPVLEEMLAELELDVRKTEPVVYRRFKPVLQPPPTVSAADLQTFVANTGPGKDPYGWGVLQTLGLAATLRLHDGNTDRFVEPAELLERVNFVLKGVLQRYEGVALGAPFVDVLLRPGADRLEAPFDAVEAKTPPRRLFEPDKALAVVQVSLRPVPAPVWHYYRLAPVWNPGPRDGSFAVGFGALAPHGFSVLRPWDGSSLVIEPPGAVAVAPVLLPIPNLSIPVNEPDPGATIVFRSLDKQAKVEGALSLWKLSAGGQPPEKVDPASVIDSGWMLEKISDPTMGSHGESAFGGFSPQAPKDWAAAFAEQEPAKEAFASLGLAARAVFPGIKISASLSEGDVPAYLDWSQRFLDHGRAKGSGNIVSVATAAPIKATPWRLAASEEGILSLSFLHADRWAHTRAYAVRPFSRYQELMVASGAHDDLSKRPNDARALLERLVRGNRLDGPLGYAVAVSQRTEKIEPPLMLGSSLWPDPEDAKAGKGAWQIVIAHHTEQQLAASNRSLFAQLGWEGVALSFVRSYREPKWPERLMNANSDLGPVPELHPKRETGYVPEALSSGVPPTDIGPLAYAFPSVAKGADIYRFPALPHHYKVLALATARAGAVVSPLAAIPQSEFPVRLPDQPARFWEAASTELVSVSERTALRVTFRLAGHVDLMPDATRAAWGPSSDTDVAWWPDPDVVYVLERRLGSPAVVDEDAEIRLVPSGPPGNAEPVVVRARGTRFKAPVDVRPVVARHGNEFTVAITLLPHVSEATDKVEGVTEALARVFNENALVARFASILATYVMRVDVAPAGDDGPTAVAAIRVAGQTLAMMPDNTPWHAEGQRLVAWAATNPTPGSAAQAKTDAGLPKDVHGWWREGDPASVPAASTFGYEDTGLPRRLKLTDIPDGDEIGELATLDPALAGVATRIKELSRELLSGGAESMTLRAVHGRAGDKRQAGSVEAPVPWPAVLAKKGP